MFLKITLIVATIAYPFFVYFGLNHFNSRVIIVFLIGLLALRWLTEKSRMTRKITAISALCVLIGVYILGSQQGLKLYPVLINIMMLLLFATSLYADQTFIEKLARFKEPDLPPSGVRYTRKVTIVWCLFFLLNGSIAFITVFWASNEIWLFYNGFLAYLLIGALVAGEWIVRSKIKHKL